MRHLTFAVALLGVAALAAGADEPKLDASRVLIVVDVSPKYPGVQQPDGHPLESLAGITPHTARQWTALAMRQPKNMPRHVGSFDIEVVDNIPAAGAQDEAAKRGSGMLAIVMLTNRALINVNTTTYQVSGDIAVAMRREGDTSWRKLYGKPFRIASADTRQPDGERPSDVDLLARHMSTILRELQFEHVLKHRVTKTRLDGDAREIDVQVTNNAARAVRALELSIPAGRDIVTARADAAIAPGESQTVTFRFQGAEPAPASLAWSRAKLTDVQFQAAAANEPRQRLFDRARQRF